MKYYNYLIVLILPFCSYVLLQKLIIDKYFSNGLISKEEIEIKDYIKLFFIGYSPFILYLYFLLLTSLKSFLGILILLVIFSFSVYSGVKFFDKLIFQLSFIKEKKPEIKSIISKEDMYKIYFVYVLVYSLLSYVLVRWGNSSIYWKNK